MAGRAEGRKNILKNMIPGEFEYQLALQKRLSSCPNVRAVVDTIQNLDLFIYPFLDGDLLRLSQRSLSKDARRYILQSALHGLANIHDREILHNGKFQSPNIPSMLLKFNRYQAWQYPRELRGRCGRSNQG